MGKDGFHQGGHDIQENKIVSRQPRSHLRSRENSNNSSPNVRMEPMDEFYRSGERG